MKILIIDDDEVFASMVAEILEDAGNQVLVVSHEPFENGVVADWPDVVLLDWWLGDRDSKPVYELLKKKRQQKAKEDIPVILMSSDPSVAQKKQQLVAADYLQKPFDFSDLFSSISKLAS